MCDDEELRRYEIECEKKLKLKFVMDVVNALSIVKLRILLHPYFL